MSYFFSAAHQDSRLLAQAGADVHAFVLARPPAFTLMDLFRLSLGQLCWMFTARSFGYNPYPHQYGVCHGDDINYLFPMEPPGFPPAVVTEKQQQVQNSWSRDPEPGLLVQDSWSRTSGPGLLVQGSWSSIPGQGGPGSRRSRAQQWQQV